MQSSEPQKLLAHLDTDGLIHFVQRLLQLRSVNDPMVGATEAAAAQAVIELAQSFGWHSIVDYVQPGRPNVIIELHGERPGPNLIFEGHTDVFSEGDGNLWSFDPYRR
jgi:succinyl-diaminopimelate desuccinylase